jgi:hypothetical protein
MSMLTAVPSFLPFHFYSNAYKDRLLSCSISQGASKRPIRTAPQLVLLPVLRILLEL